MNKEQLELLDDAYKNYSKLVKFSSNPFDFKIKTAEALEIGGKNVEGWGQFQIDGEFTQEEFINKITSDDKFAKKWGVIIYTRDLSIEERWELYHKSDIKPLTPQTGYDDKELHRICDDCYIPTKLLTITYNNKTIEYYE